MVWHARPVAGGRHSTKKRRDIPTCVTTCITGRCNCLMAASVERFKCRLASLLFSFFFCCSAANFPRALDAAHCGEEWDERMKVLLVE